MGVWSVCLPVLGEVGSLPSYMKNEGAVFWKFADAVYMFLKRVARPKIFS
jgi:hypothetical protein